MREYTSPIAPLMTAYASYQQASGRWSDSYAVMLGVFDNYCKANFPDLKNLSQGAVDAWCAKRETENNNSCRRRIYPIASFIHFLQKRGMTDIKLPVMPQKEPSTYIPHAFTEEELANFFDACDTIAHSPSKRKETCRLTLPVLFRLLYSSGIRTTEARLLKKRNADLEQGILNIEYSKGHAQHFVVLHESVLELMREYDAAIAAIHPDRDYFFPFGNKSKPLTAAWIQYYFKKMWFQNNSAYAVPYELRHNYATENINSWTDDGFDFNDKLLYLSKSMGHSVIESTKYYYSLVPRLAGVLAGHTDEDETIPEVCYESH